MYFRVDMPNSTPPQYMVYNSDPDFVNLQAVPLNCGVTVPRNLPGAAPAGVQHTVCNNTGAHITIYIIKA